MTRYLARLAAMVGIIFGTGLVSWWGGWSRTAVLLAMILAAALCWVPALLALDQIGRVRRLEHLQPHPNLARGPWASMTALHARRLCDPDSCPMDGVHR